MKRITSSSNPIIKEIKGLYKKRERWDKKLFIIEGVKIVEEYIKWEGEPKYILFSEELFNVTGGKELFDILIDKSEKIINVSNNILKELADTENPQGILAVVNFNISTLEDLLNKQNKYIVFLDELQDPGNVGTIIRTADAFKASGVVLTKNCVDIYNPKVVRATMGSLFHIPLVYVEEKIDFLNILKKKDIKIYATSLEGKSYIYETDFKKDFILVIGNESKGVSEEILNMADSMIKIPMVGSAESLNAAIASSIIMYEVVRQRANIS